MTQLASGLGSGVGSEILARRKGGRPPTSGLVGLVFKEVSFRVCGHGRWCADHIYQGRSIQLVVMEPKGKLPDGGSLDVKVLDSIGGNRHTDPFMWSVEVVKYNQPPQEH